MSQEVYAKQFSIGEILTTAWKYFTENIQLVLGITLTISVPINLILAFFPLGDSLDSTSRYYQAVGILYGLLGIVATMAVAYAIARRVDGQDVTVSDALKKAFSRWLPAIGSSILYGLFVVGLSLLLIVPGIIYGVFWMFTVYNVVLRDRAGKGALDESKRIIAGRWWTAFGYSLMLGLLTFLVAFLTSLPFSFLPDHSVVDFLASLSTAILTSYFSVAMVIFFLNFDHTRQKEDTKPNEVE
ncbi:MAG: hypothetical protein HYV34_01670 [Candidatus Kerfeldbacteria bacterium]|nr:hypothetical protein [Candidatus Kerfeldbacteria bacterium]